MKTGEIKRRPHHRFLSRRTGVTETEVLLCHYDIETSTDSERLGVDGILDIIAGNSKWFPRFDPPV